MEAAHWAGGRRERSTVISGRWWPVQQQTRRHAFTVIKVVGIPWRAAAASTGRNWSLQGQRGKGDVRFDAARFVRRFSAGPRYFLRTCAASPDSPQRFTRKLGNGNVSDPCWPFPIVRSSPPFFTSLRVRVHPYISRIFLGKKTNRQFPMFSRYNLRRKVGYLSGTRAPLKRVLRPASSRHHLPSCSLFPFSFDSSLAAAPPFDFAILLPSENFSFLASLFVSYSPIFEKRSILIVKRDQNLLFLAPFEKSKISFFLSSFFQRSNVLERRKERKKEICQIRIRLGK